MGIDANRDHIKKASIMFPEKNFQLGVVSSWTNKTKYDISTCMFYLHGFSSYRREKIIETAPEKMQLLNFQLLNHNVTQLIVYLLSV